MKKKGLSAVLLVLVIAVATSAVATAQPTLTCNATVDVNNLTIVFHPEDPMPWTANGDFYNMTINITDGTNVVDCDGKVLLQLNTSMAWLNNGTGGWGTSAIVTVNNGTSQTFSIAAFNNKTYSNVTANLTAEAMADNGTTNNTVFNYTIIDFYAPSQLAWITGDYRKAVGGLLYESEVGGVWITVLRQPGNVPLYYYLDTTNDAGYTARVPLGNYSVEGQAYTYQAASNTVNVDEPDKTFTADLVFVSDRTPSRIVLTYEDGSKNKANPANGQETQDEMLIIEVYDQYGDLITDTVTVTIEPPGDLNVQDPDAYPDRTVDTSVTVTATGGTGYVWVTSLGANQTTMPGPIVTVNITATSNTNNSASDMATKTYVLKGNSSIMGQVYWVDEDNGVKGVAENATVWAVYAGMSNHSLAYISGIFPWLVSTTDEHGVYVLDGIAVHGEEEETCVYIYVTYDGWNGINDTIGAPSLSSKGILDPLVDTSRGGRTNMFIAEAEYQCLQYDGDTENHDIKLRTPEPIGYNLTVSEPRHTLVVGGDSVDITVNLYWYPKSNTSDLHPADGIVTATLNNSLAILDNGTAQGQSVWVKVTNGVGTVKIISKDQHGAVDVNFSFKYNDRELGMDVTISKHETKLIVDVAKVSGDLTDESGTQLKDPASENQLIVVLWVDRDGDGRINTSVDTLAPASGETRDGIDSLQVVRTLYPNAMYDNQVVPSIVPVNVSLYNPRFSDKEFGHYSYFNVTTGLNYIVEAIWLAKPPASTADAVNQITSNNYTISFVPFYLNPGAGTVTVDIAIPTPAEYISPAAPGTTADQVKAEILTLIVQYINNPSDELKQQILNKIIEYLQLI